MSFSPGVPALNPLLLHDLQTRGYVAEVAQTAFDVDYLQQHIVLPAPGQTPRIIGWSGPSRSGTSGLLFLLAGHEAIDRAYFQPQKTILRQGGPDFELHATDRIVCMKEVFRACCVRQGHDPIEALVNAGMSPAKICWMTLLRDPVQSFASWYTHFPGTTTESFIATYHYTLDFFWRWRNRGVTMLPLAYDLLEGRERQVLGALFARAGLDIAPLALDFDMVAIRAKLVQGQAADHHIYRRYLEPTLARKKFMYTKNDHEVPEPLRRDIDYHCRAAYDAFTELVCDELKITRYA